MKKILIGIFSLFVGFFVFLFVYIGINDGFSLEDWNQEQVRLAKQHQTDYAHWSFKAYRLIDLCYDSKKGTNKKKRYCELMHEAILKQQDSYRKWNKYMKMSYGKYEDMLKHQPSYSKIMEYNKLVQKRGY